MWDSFVERRLYAVNQIYKLSIYSNHRISVMVFIIIMISEFTRYLLCVSIFENVLIWPLHPKGS